MQNVDLKQSEEMLAYQKLILTKVSFNWDSFQKELTKSSKWLTSEHFQELLRWVWDKFQNVFSELRSTLEKVFSFSFFDETVSV